MGYYAIGQIAETWRIAYRRDIIYLDKCPRPGGYLAYAIYHWANRRNLEDTKVHEDITLMSLGKYLRSGGYCSP
jgi:hypothetical protein